MEFKLPFKIQYGANSINVITNCKDDFIMGNILEIKGEEKEINEYTFYNCTSLQSINFSKCTTIGEQAFGYCSSLQSISFPQCITIGNNAFQYCFSLQSVNFPQCTNIGTDAFDNCISLQSVSFPQCTSIGSFAFYYCTSLQSVYLLASSVCTLANSYVFDDTPIQYSSYLSYFGSIYVPSSLVDAYKSATNWTYYSDRITAYIP